MGRREIKRKVKLMTEEIKEKMDNKIFTYYEADKLVLDIIKSHLTAEDDWEYTRGIFDMRAEFDIINFDYNSSFLSYEIDDMIYLGVCYEFIDLPKDLKEEEEDRIKNLKVKIKWIQKPTKQDFDDRDIIYKDEMLAEEE